MKTCIKCGETKNLSSFSADKTRPDGKRSTCRECVKTYNAKYRNENPEKVAAAHQDWVERNQLYFKIYNVKSIDKIRKRHVRYYEKNKDKIDNYVREWRAKNPEKVKEYERKKRSTPRGRLESAISAGISHGIMRGSRKSRNTFQMLGYTIDDLRNHLEKLFVPGMTWENYGRGGWHVDHITPKSAFNYETPDDIDFREAWSLKNLQPLWENDNLKKHAKLTKPFQPSLLLAANDNGKATTNEETIYEAEYPKKRNYEDHE